MRKLPVSALLLGLLVVVASCLPGLSTRPTVKIGLVAPFEGLHRHLGYEALHAVKLAMGERNQAGGVGGYTVELVALNDDQDPESATQRAREMTVDPDVVGVIGHFGEETTVAALSVYDKAGLALVVPASTVSAVTSGGHTQTYRLVAADEAIGAAAARYAVLERASSTVAVVGGAADLVDSFVSTARQLGAEVFVHQGQEHQILVSELSTEDPDILFFAGEGSEGAELVLALTGVGQGSSILGANGLDTPHYVQIAGETAEGTVYVSLAPPLLDARFSRAYEESSGAIPGPYAVLSYDAAGLMLDALERCIALEGKPSRLCVANALAGTTGYEGLTGTISFDKWGQATGREVYFFEIAGGQYPGEFRTCSVCSQ